MASKSGGGSKSSQSTKGGKQTTLFQTWGYSGNESVLSTSGAGIKTDNSASQNVGAPESDMFAGDDDDDEMLNRALEASMAQFAQEKFSRAQTSAAASSRPSTSRLSGASLPDPSNFEELPVIPDATPLEVLPGFDVESGRTWIYPTNYPVRKYQYDIVRSCLFENTLVALPTGLGKTFIAAVVMYNFYRWYPRGRIVFMAPTKPLVAQQIDACFKIMGVPQIDMSEMTGNVHVNIRKEAWKQKRIFFLTPQVMSNDLSRGLFPADEVKLLVVDEAHRAQGDYAYCQVIKELTKSNSIFRVIALSATPGTDLNAVRHVIQNLLISKIELRNEESPDIVPYTFKRTIEKVVVPLGDELKKVKLEFLSILETFVKRLTKFGLLARSANSIDPTRYTKFGILQSRNEFRQNPPARMDPTQRGTAEGDFASAISLYHAYELLMNHGTRSFYNFVSKVTGEDVHAAGGGKTTPTSGINKRLRYDLNRNQVWQNLMSTLKSKYSEDMNNSRLNTSGPRVWSQFGNTGDEVATHSSLALGHPKLAKLRDMVLQHFKDKEKEKVATRVMIFSKYRDSVQEITACLHAFKPLVKVMEFVGQAGAKGKKGLTQKEQLEVMKRFREGGFNTLVSTCVGEEGLDIGEIDLIVCYDVSKSPIGLVQRMGRTGRKRAGKIIVLVTEGKEEHTYNQSVYSKNSINRAIVEKNKLTSVFCPSPRMVPRGLEPVCHKMVMIVADYVQDKSGRNMSDKQRSIPGMQDRRSPNNGGQRGLAFRDTCGFLTSDELKYWNENFFLDPDTESTLPILHKRKETWNLNGLEIDAKIAQGDVDEVSLAKRHFDLSEWLLWQNNQQPRHFVSQSSIGKVFENIQGFILMHKFQKGISSQEGMEGNGLVDDDFGYGAEMAAWLETDDIFEAARNNRNRKKKTPVKIASPSPKKMDEEPQSPVLSQFQPPHSQPEVDRIDDQMNEDIGIYQSPEKVRTEEEKAVDQILGPAQNVDLEVASPPDLDEAFFSRFPSEDEIRSFDVVLYWTKLEKKYLRQKDDGKRKSTKPPSDHGDDVPASPPMSPVICPSQQHLRALKEVSGHKTSTPNAAGGRKATFDFSGRDFPSARKSFDKENLFKDDDLSDEYLLQDVEKISGSGIDQKCDEVKMSYSKQSLNQDFDSPSIAAALSCSFDNIAATIENDVGRSGPKNSFSKQDQDLFSPSVAAAMACSFGTNVTAKRDDESMFPGDMSAGFLDAVAMAASFEDNVKPDNNKSLFSATQLVNLLDKSSSSKTSFSNVEKNCEKDPISNEKSSEKEDNSSTYSLDNLPPLKYLNENCAGEVDLFSSFELGSPELEEGVYVTEEELVDSHPESKKSPEMKQANLNSEFKMPNLEDFELRSKTPKKVQTASRLVTTTAVTAKKFCLEEADKPTVKVYQSPTSKSLFDQTELVEDPDESVFVVRRKPKSIAISSSSEDEDHLQSSSDDRKKIKRTGSQMSVARAELTKRKPRPKKSSEAFHFLDREAKLSEDEFHDGVSSDESGSSEPAAYDASFVDDCTQRVDIDQRAMYLQSVKSPLKPRHVMPRPPPRPMKREDIYSQFPQDSELMDEYEDDSFVVANSVVEYETSLDELDMVDEFESDEEVARKTRLKRKKMSTITSSGSENDVGNAKVTSQSPPRKKLKKKSNRQRIMTADTSSSDHDDNEIVILSQHKVVESPPAKTSSETTSEATKISDDRRSRPLALCSREVESMTRNASNERNSQTIESVKDLSSSTTKNSQNNSSEKASQNSSIGKSGVLPSCSTLGQSTLTSPENSSTTLGRSSLDTMTKRTVVIGATEVHRSVELISELKHRYNMDVVVRSGLNVGYLLSPRLGVHRMSCKEFCNGAQRSSLVEQCQKMNDLFEKPCLIVETERPDNPDVVRAFSGGFLEQHGGAHRTKYVDVILSQLSQSKFQVLFSGSQVESAQMLSALSAKEARKGHTLPYPLRLSDTAERVLPFFQSLPGVGFGTALLFAAQFNTAGDVAGAAQATMMRKIGLDEGKARKIKEYFRRNFNPEMTDTGN